MLVHAPELCEATDEEVARVSISVATRHDLHAVTGRQENHLAYARWVQKARQRRVDGAIAHAQLLPHGDGRCVVVQSYYE